MQLGLGVLRWNPEQFWNSTVRELYAGVEGYNESQGEKKTEPLTRADVEELQSLMEQFPDEKAK